MVDRPGDRGTIHLEHQSQPSVRDLQAQHRQGHQHPVSKLKFVMTPSPGYPMPAVAPPFMALSLDLRFPRATQLDQQPVQMWTLQAREGRMGQDRAAPFFFTP